MQTIYKRIEPQPESKIVNWGDAGYCLESELFKPPYKVGDEIECSNCNGTGYIWYNGENVGDWACNSGKHKIISCTPENRDGVLEWKVEAE